MNGLCRAIGADGVITLDGRLYRLPPMTLGDFGTVEAYLLEQRRWERLRPLLAVRNQLPEDDWEDAKQEALSLKSIAEEDVFAWIATDAGLAFTLWLLLEKCYPERFTVDGLMMTLDRMTPEDRLRLVLARNQAATIDAAADADWPKSGGKGTGSRPSWKQVVWQLIQPPEWGGHGLSPDDAKRLTFHQARLIRTDAKGLGGVQRMSTKDARAMLGLPPPGPPKKWADPIARERELYEKRFGHPMPAGVTPGIPEHLKARGRRK